MSFSLKTQFNFNLPEETTYLHVAWFHCKSDFSLTEYWFELIPVSNQHKNNKISKLLIVRKLVSA